MSGFPKTCTTCGRRGVDGTSRCELHPAPVVREAERLARHPYRTHYTSARYRRNRARALRRAGGLCEVCREPHGPERQVDHVIALRDGGGDGLVNLKVLCPACVRIKNRADKARRRT